MVARGLCRCLGPGHLGMCGRLLPCGMLISDNCGRGGETEGKRACTWDQEPGAYP